MKIWLCGINTMCLQGLDPLSMRESAFNHNLTLLQQVVNAVWGLLYTNVNPYTQGWIICSNIVLQLYLMSKCLSWCACPAQPAISCHDRIHDARLGVNEVDRGEGWTLKEECTEYHELNKRRDEVHESWLIKCELCVRAPRCAWQGVTSML
jgi:hypothetical protein